MSTPRVSIIIVNWKTPDLLAGCLDSIAADHGYGSFEIIVIDNASGDHTVPLIQTKYKHVQLIINSTNAGFSKASNQGIAKSSGKYVLLLNPDTVVVDSAISKLADFMDAHPRCGAAGPKVLNLDGTLQLACRRAFPTPAAAFFRLSYLSRLFPQHPTFSKYNLTYADPDQVLEVDALSGSCMMIRRQVVEEIGVLDEDIFMFGEDIDWCWRMKQVGWSVMYGPSGVVYHVHGAASRLRPIGATINLHKGMEVFYRKHLAQKYWAPFNLLVYAAIWCRAALFILINLARSIITRQERIPIGATAQSDLEIHGSLTKSSD